MSKKPNMERGPLDGRAGRRPRGFPRPYTPRGDKTVKQPSFPTKPAGIQTYLKWLWFFRNIKRWRKNDEE